MAVSAVLMAVSIVDAKACGRLTAFKAGGGMPHAAKNDFDLRHGV
jgi:hypothetical protein